MQQHENIQFPSLNRNPSTAQYSIPSGSRAPPSGGCIQPCFPSEGSCTPARGSWWCSSSLWSWPPGCPPGCVGCTTLTSTSQPCQGSYQREIIVFRECMKILKTGHRALFTEPCPVSHIGFVGMNAVRERCENIKISLTCLTAAAQRLHTVAVILHKWK